MAKKITVAVVPVQGKGRHVEVDATHTTVEQVLKAADIAVSDNLALSVNGNPADLKAAVTEGDSVTVTEKVRGS